MNETKLIELLTEIGLNVEAVKPGVYKGHSCNVSQWPIFRIWLNKKAHITIKTRGVQRSFNLSTKEELKNTLQGFEII